LQLQQTSSAQTKKLERELEETKRENDQKIKKLEQDLDAARKSLNEKVSIIFIYFIMFISLFYK